MTTTKKPKRCGARKKIKRFALGNRKAKRTWMPPEWEMDNRRTRMMAGAKRGAE